MIRTALAVVLSALLLSPAQAASPGQDLLLLFGGGNKPVVSLDFTQGNTANFQNNVTVSRPSLATITDATGAITYVPNNLLIRSNALSNAAWTTGNLTSIVASGSQWTITENTSNAAHYFYGTGVTIVGNYITSVTVSAGTQRYISLRGLSQSAGSSPWITFDTQSLSINANADVINSGFVFLGGGSYQVWLKGLANGTVSDNIVVAGSNVSTAPTPSNVLGNVYVGTSLTWNASNVVVSPVTYETAPRPSDQVVTTSAAYYGPVFDYAPGWVAGGSSQFRVEGARTNLFLNTASPATQTITVANASAYANSFYGTGTVTLSGALTQVMTGSANTRTIYNGTTATTSLVATVAGLSATAYPQVELGAFATSTIPQAGSATARAADSVSSTGALAIALAAGPWAYTWTSESALTTSCVTGAAGAFTWPNYGWMKSLKVYKAGTPTAKVTC